MVGNNNCIAIYKKSLNLGGCLWWLPNFQHSPTTFLHSMHPLGIKIFASRLTAGLHLYYRFRRSQTYISAQAIVKPEISVYLSLSNSRIS